MRRGVSLLVAKKRSALVAALFVVTSVVLFATTGIVGAVLGSVAFAIFGWVMTRPPSGALVGQKCAKCGEGIYIESQADRCTTCSVPLHARCIDAHVSDMHVTPSAAARPATSERDL